MSYMKNWLPHLKDSIPQFVFGDRIDTYVMALEGWRRGLELKFSIVGAQKRVSFTLSDGEKEHRFSITRGDKVTREAIRICINKGLTKEYLSKKDIPFPRGETFGKKYSNEKIISLTEQLNFPLVVKPFNGDRGIGVVTNIKNSEELRSALEYVREELGYSKVIVEQFFNGEEFRVFVVGSNVAGAIKRIPANVVGDGEHSIAELIEIKNYERKKVPNLHQRLIKIDREIIERLESIGYNLETVLKKDEILFLREKGNLSTGGEAIDCTDALPEIVKKTAIDACNAIPGLEHGGVDILYNEKNNQAVVVEVNSRPGVGGHLFPKKGLARDIPKAIIDYYFPDTIYNERSSFYFNPKEYIEILTSGKATEIVLPKAPFGDIVQKKYTVSNIAINNAETLHKKIYSMATKLNLHGFVEQKEDETNLDVVIAGKISSVDAFASDLEILLDDKYEQFQITEEEYHKPVMLGFENGFYRIEKIHKAITSLKKIEEKYRLLREKYHKVTTSKGYRYLNVIRNFKKRFTK